MSTKNNDLPMSNRLMTIFQVAEYLEVKSKATIYKMIKDGTLPQPTYILGKRCPRLDRVKIDKMLDAL
ncbi:MAG: helix-turn-helix domain-containing protein [Sulfurimonas sp.]|nr:helix-turn-helix domain-containing protein [Sulfurimonas sp.]